MKSKVDPKYLSKLKSKLREKTGKSILKAKPQEIKDAFKDTVASVGNTRAILYERNRLLRLKNKKTNLVFGKYSSWGQALMKGNPEERAKAYKMFEGRGVY